MRGGHALIAASPPGRHPGRAGRRPPRRLGRGTARRAARPRRARPHATTTRPRISTPTSSTRARAASRTRRARRPRGPRREHHLPVDDRPGVTPPRRCARGVRAAPRHAGHRRRAPAGRGSASPPRRARCGPLPRQRRGPAQRRGGPDAGPRPLHRDAPARRALVFDKLRAPWSTMSCSPVPRRRPRASSCRRPSTATSWSGRRRRTSRARTTPRRPPRGSPTCARRRRASCPSWRATT